MYLCIGLERDTKATKSPVFTVTISFVDNTSITVSASNDIRVQDLHMGAAEKYGLWQHEYFQLGIHNIYITYT